MTTMTQHNARTERKSLAEQIDRLDQILDGLAEGLNEAVISAVQEAVNLAVRQAIQAVVTEVRTNPELLTLFRGSVAQAPPAAAQPWAEEISTPPGGFLRPGRAWVRQQWGRAFRATKALTGMGQRGVAAGWQLLRRFRGPVLLAVGVGAATGLAAYCAGPWLAAGAAWLGGFATTLAVRAGLAMRRVLATLSFSGT
jgi:hypothetical protein